MIFAQFPNCAIGTDNASNRTFGSRDSDFLNRESGSTEPIFPQFGIGQSGRTMRQIAGHLEILPSIPAIELPLGHPPDLAKQETRTGINSSIAGMSTVMAISV